MKIATFNRFELEMSEDAVRDCSHSGPCDNDVDIWANKIVRPDEITSEKLALELKDYGAWDAKELQDDAQNWKRLIWIAAGNIQDEKES
jgi:hypothetical protein